MSLLFNLQPDKVAYDHSLMHKHLVQMFQMNKIEHFPRIIRSGDPQLLFTLDEIQHRKLIDNKIYIDSNENIDRQKLNSNIL